MDLPGRDEEGDPVHGFGAACWENVLFPPTPISGTLSPTVPVAEEFEGEGAFATVFMRRTPWEFVGDGGMPVENSNAITPAL